VGLCIFGRPTQKYIVPPIKRVKLLKHWPVSQKVKHEDSDRHDITEILLKVALNTITLTLVILLQTIA